MLDIYELQIFLAAAEAGSFSEAGRRLQLSQPAVSMQIRSLEKRLEADLFHRAGRHIRLTEVGEALIPMARDLVNLSIQTEESIASVQGDVVGLLKLACSTTAGKYVLPKLIAGFVEQYPHVRVACDVGSRGTALSALLENSAHIAITSLREPIKELEYRQFTADPIVLTVPASHLWAERSIIQVEELYQERFIVREPTSGTQQAVTHALIEHNVSVNDLDVVMTLGNSEAILMAVAEGIGMAFVSQRAVAEIVELERVVPVPIAGLEIAQQLYLARHAQRAATSAQNAFWNHVYAAENRPILFSNSFGPNTLS